MKPYYDSDGITIYHGDCRDILPQLPKVDLVLTDPPYGKQWARGNYSFSGIPQLAEKIENLSWDKERPPKECFDLMLFTSKNQIIFGGNYFTDYLYPSNCWIVWDKKGDSFDGIPMADCELVWTSFNKVVKKYKFIQQGYLSDSKEPRVHPTQKPTELIKRILLDFSLQQDLILDPFMGSGTTLRAAKDLDRKAIGIEIKERYCEIAAKRMSQMAMAL